MKKEKIREYYKNKKWMDFKENVGIEIGRARWSILLRYGDALGRLE